MSRADQSVADADFFQHTAKKTLFLSDGPHIHDFRLVRRGFGAGLRPHVAFEAYQVIILEVHGDVMCLAQFSAGLERVVIIPAILVEGVVHQRRTEQVLDLIPGQSRLDTVELILLDDISLLNVDLVGERGTAGDKCDVKP